MIKHIPENLSSDNLSIYRIAILYFTLINLKFIIFYQK